MKNKTSEYCIKNHEFVNVGWFKNTKSEKFIEIENDLFDSITILKNQMNKNSIFETRNLLILLIKRLSTNYSLYFCVLVIASI